MTDEQILNALKSCGDGIAICDDCAYYGRNHCSLLAKQDIIARFEGLKAENESLVREADENAALAMLRKMRADDLEKENAELKVRLEKAVELPFVPCDHHIEMWAAQIKESCVDQCATIVIPCYLYIKCEDKNAAVERLNELRQYADN